MTTWSRREVALHRRWLLELTRTPTAAGREHRVVDWVRGWHAQRSDRLTLEADGHGNLWLGLRRVKGRRLSGRPIVLSAHMDHPAFVVSEATADGDRCRVVADFRGGVSPSYFVGSPVRLHPTGRPHEGPAALRGVVESITPSGPDRPDHRCVIRMVRAAEVVPGDVLVWDTGRQRVSKGVLHTGACDNLAGVAAGLSALDAFSLRAAVGGKAGRAPADVRVLLTRAEEVGFVGAIAACRAGDIPRGARVIVLETSRSYADSPIGGGPIVRVGDRTSTFDPGLTLACGRVAESIAGEDGRFVWQRKLMPGGTCEATPYVAFGHAATCLCLPLGNYHNMAPAGRVGGRERIAAERISLSDFDGLVRLLLGVAQRLDDRSLLPPIRRRMTELLRRRRGLLR